MNNLNLSDKGKKCLCGCERIMIFDTDVKEFIRLLKEDINNTLEEGITRNKILPRDWAMDRINDVINKLAGDKLI